MRFKIYKSLLEELVRTSFDKAYNPRDPLPFIATGEDYYLISADNHPNVMDNVHKIPYTRHRHFVEVNCWNKIREIMKKHNIVAAAHTHPFRASPSKGDIKHLEIIKEETHKKIYMMIISNLTPYISTIYYIKLSYFPCRKSEQKLHKEMTAMLKEGSFRGLYERCGEVRNKSPPKKLLVEKTTQEYMTHVSDFVKIYDSKGKEVGLKII